MWYSRSFRAGRQTWPPTLTEYKNTPHPRNLLNTSHLRAQRPFLPQPYVRIGILQSQICQIHKASRNVSYGEREHSVPYWVLKISEQQIHFLGQFLDCTNFRQFLSKKWFILSSQTWRKAATLQMNWGFKNIADLKTDWSSAAICQLPWGKQKDRQQA